MDNKIPVKSSTCNSHLLHIKVGILYLLCLSQPVT